MLLQTSWLQLAVIDTTGQAFSVTQQMSRIVRAWEPTVGGRILVLDKRYFQMILEGTKTLEIRHQCLKSGLWHVGHHGEIYGTLHLGEGFQVMSDKDWIAKKALHRHPSDTLPYRRTCALPVSHPCQFEEVIRYVHHLGSIGTARYEPSAPKRKTTDLEESVAKRPAMASECALQLRLGFVEENIHL